MLSPADVAERCGLSRKAVYRAIERGELRASRLCSRLRVRPEDVAAWIDATVIQKPQVAAAIADRPRPAAEASGLRVLLKAGRSQ